MCAAAGSSAGAGSSSGERSASSVLVVVGPAVAEEVVPGADSASGVMSGASGGLVSMDRPTVATTAMAVAVTAALVSTLRSAL